VLFVREAHAPDRGEKIASKLAPTGAAIAPIECIARAIARPTFPMLALHPRRIDVADPEINTNAAQSCG
jgi:hypothetical protein